MKGEHRFWLDGNSWKRKESSPLTDTSPYNLPLGYHLRFPFVVPLKRRRVLPTIEDLRKQKKKRHDNFLTCIFLYFLSMRNAQRLPLLCCYRAFKTGREATAVFCYFQQLSAGALSISHARYEKGDEPSTGEVVDLASEISWCYQTELRKHSPRYPTLSNLHVLTFHGLFRFLHQLYFSTHYFSV